MAKSKGPFKIMCNDLNPLTNNTDNIIFLLKTTDEIYDYNYEVISTFDETYIFNDSLARYGYIKTWYISLCFPDTPPPPISVVFDASSRSGSETGSVSELGSD